MAPGDPRSGVPPVVSARTSSNRTAAQAAAATAADRSSRRGYTNEGSDSPRAVNTGDGQQDRERQRSNGNTQTNGGNDEAVAAANAAARSRRRTQQSPPDALPHRPSGSREPRNTNSTSAVHRQVAATATSTPGMSREPSEVLNRVVISKPEVDIERERERIAESIPNSSPIAQSSAMGTLSVVPGEGIEDGGRGGSRTRHDHSSSTGKREKNSRFGEYFLGNTLGEGEFGKVKMGWKQEGGVQVSGVRYIELKSTNRATGCYQAHQKRQRWHQPYETRQDLP
jgi:protein-serine/threonine kinase